MLINVYLHSLHLYVCICFITWVNPFAFLCGHFNWCGCALSLQVTAGLEKDAVKPQLREEFRKAKQEPGEEKIRLKAQLVKGLEDLVKKHSLEIKSAQASMDAERKKLHKVGLFY